MPFQKVEFSFPDEEQEDTTIEIEDSGEVEIDLTGKKTAEDYKEPEAEPEPEPEIEAEVEIEDDVEVEVYDDTPKADRNRKASEPPEDVTEEELENYSKKVQNRLKHFSKSYHDERRAKESAQRERVELEKLAQRLVDENKELKSNVAKNQEALLEQAKLNANSEVESAKQAYKTAYEAGDSDAILAAQESLTNVKIKSDKLNNFKIPSLQGQKTSVEQNVSSPQAEAPVVDAKAQAWAKQNTWFGQDDEMTSLALGLHNKLAKQGIDLQSDEYYEAIDTRMRQVFPDNFEDIAELEAEKPKRQANVVAPATRSMAPKKVKLTQTQVAIAKRLGVPLELYAQKVAEEMRKANG